MLATEQQKGEKGDNLGKGQAFPEKGFHQVAIYMPGWMHEDPHGVRHTKRHLGRLAWLDCEKGKHSLHKTRHAPKPHCMHWCEQISSIKRVGRLAHGHRCISASRTQNSTKEVH